MDFETKLNNLS